MHKKQMHLMFIPETVWSWFSFPLLHFLSALSLTCTCHIDYLQQASKDHVLGTRCLDKAANYGLMPNFSQASQIFYGLSRLIKKATDVP